VIDDKTLETLARWAEEDDKEHYVRLVAEYKKLRDAMLELGIALEDE
jgi:hypothetical protein